MDESSEPAGIDGVVRLRAPAKLTLDLRITGVRADGLHLIDATMAELDLADRIEFRVHPFDQAASIVVDGPFAGSVGGEDPERNLVIRAFRLLGYSADVRLTKHIPAGAGLGGGSADAGAVLRWGGYRDLERAAALGADVAFCMVGGRARVRGIGEQVDPQPEQPTTITLTTPPILASTPVVYRAWDELGGPAGDHGNDLEPAALHAYPELAESRDFLWELSGKRPRLAGSGSTWFVDGAFEHHRTVVTLTR